MTVNEFFEQGQIHFDKDEFDLAHEFFSKAAKQAPENAEYLGWVARTLAAMDRFSEAIDIANRAIGLNPDCAVAYYTRARSYHEQGKIEQALPDYTKATELGFTDAYLNLGVVWWKLGNNQKALENALLAYHQDFTTRELAIHNIGAYIAQIFKPTWEYWFYVFPLKASGAADLWNRKPENDMPANEKIGTWGREGWELVAVVPITETLPEDTRVLPNQFDKRGHLISHTFTKELLFIFKRPVTMYSPDIFSRPTSLHVNPLDAIEKLSELKVKGLVTEAEFENKKHELLERL